MILKSCRVVALEGPPGAGKTTTALALTGLLRANSYLVEYSEESVRRNPFVEDFTLHGQPLQMDMELHLFTKTIADQILAARGNEWLICDKTPASLLAYAKVLMGSTLSTSDRRLLKMMKQLFEQWSSSYDLVFLLDDFYETGQSRDPVRAKVIAQAASVGLEIAAVLRASRALVVEVPRGLELDERVDWMFASLKRLGSQS